MPLAPRRLQDLLIDPRETMEVELKGWLDFSDSAHKALIAKAALALANHGGGYIVIGFSKSETGCSPVLNRPVSLASFNTDAVNAIIALYAEPVFHCDVAITAAPDGSLYPIIVVPGGHRVPIRSKRDGPNGQTIKQYCYYVRRPGPQSDTPKTGQEWDDLIRRCIATARDDLLDQIRTIIAGGPASEPTPSDEERLLSWVKGSLERWEERVAEMPAESEARMPLGRFSVAYHVDGIDPPTLGGLKDALTRAEVRHSGWPPFWVPTRKEIAPYIHGDVIECWLGRDGSFGDAAHADFWRAAPAGNFFLVRGYQEDSTTHSRAVRGESFDITVWTWRVGEALLHAASVARMLGNPDAKITIQFSWTGLNNRKLATIGDSDRNLHDDYVSHQDSFEKVATVFGQQISDSLPEVTGKIVYPLYEMFDFFRLPESLVTEEITRMRTNRF